MLKNFQIIGIRPLEGCHEDFKKILKIDQLYLFDERYTIAYNDKNEIVQIAFNVEKDSIPRNFYSKDLNIQINAVIGGNGSGKSALAELFLYFMFYYGIQKDHISKHQQSSDPDNDGFGAFRQIKYAKEINMMNEYLNVELVYIYDDILYQIILRRNNFEIKTFKQNESTYSLVKEVPFNDFIFPFYSMYVNYSHHGLNTNVEGEWLRTLFHKNDGYQLPVVINPYRVKGNIDINVENYLSRDRVFTNVIDTADESLILQNIEIEYIEISRDSSKKIAETAPYEKRSEDLDFKIRTLYQTFFKDEDYPVTITFYRGEVEKYLFRKIRTITERYLDYKEYNFIVNQSAPYSDIQKNELKSFFKKLYQDRSHVTLKIRQSLNFLHNDLYQIDHEEGTKHFELDEIIESIAELRDNQFFTETIDYLPPPIFMTRFHFKDKSHFDQLSSGEKQQIYSIHSIVYHLKNIDSVHSSIGDKLKYNSVFLILDEIELYYHPQAQKSTISRLLYVLEKSKLNYVKYLNIMFLTHSPFILSDIPSEFTLKLKEGKIFTNQNKHKTFAANITDLLTDSFFLENGLMGDFAKEKIQETINWLNSFIIERMVNPEVSEDIINQHEALIKIIDEPLLNYKLTEMFQTVFTDRIDKIQTEKQIKDLAQKAGINLKDLI
ncbi:hypothetical protein NBRC110019_03800 [Neptunitalea chrysea]|uniref:ATPase AAA-type core domain-containing protein n=1 Tax=Neptunitalea chrysea TaxID=1647581 RepID=A0A9W6B2Y0_9FLAO|nr:hypothetical protein [Neptunitalea chrysea]GLB51341.1 hypothetical protein NBRC110019_03800 [Neptunitalea chrysea]